MGKTKFLRSYWFAGIILGLVPLITAAESPSDKQLVGDLTAVYEEWLKACAEGDLKAYRHARDPEDMEQIEKKIGRRLTSEDISASAAWNPQLSNLQFLGVSKEASWAQLRYHGGDAAADAAGPRVNFNIMLFHLHEDGWKLVKIGSLSDRKYNESGELMTIEMIEIPDRLQLPSLRKDGT